MARLRVIGVHHRQLHAVAAIALRRVQRAAMEEHHVAGLEFRANRLCDPFGVLRRVVAEEFLVVELIGREPRRM
ncbi:hypothetical protein G6F31_020530 [Rhizopus arrhizus]|nr:hypothetical protein G6F31_020530 [Rhizopus arrhizus]